MSSQATHLRAREQLVHELELRPGRVLRLQVHDRAVRALHVLRLREEEAGDRGEAFCVYRQDNSG